MHKNTLAVCMDLEHGILTDIPFLCSPHHNERPQDCPVSLLVIHNISLPPGQFCQSGVESDISHLFMGTLDGNKHPYYSDIAAMEVSAHCLICRSGETIQFVSFDKRAWHAGVSVFQGRKQCNDFSIGIELEGTDTKAYTGAQYDKLVEISRLLMSHYPHINLSRIVGHDDIAPGRKTDPGVAFDWGRFRSQLMGRESR